MKKNEFDLRENNDLLYNLAVIFSKKFRWNNSILFKK